MLMIPLSLTVALFVSGTQAAAWKIGNCLNVSGVANFDVGSYSGVWFEYANTFEVFQIGSKCVRATYTQAGDGITVKNEQVNKWFNFYNSIEGSARFADPNKTDIGELYVSFNNIPFQVGSEGKVAPNYVVVDTDYTGYAIVYSCSEVWASARESLWVLTRSQTPASTLVDTAYSKMTDLGLPVQALRTTSQQGCSALPA